MSMSPIAVYSFQVFKSKQENAIILKEIQFLVEDIMDGVPQAANICFQEDYHVFNVLKTRPTDNLIFPRGHSSQRASERHKELQREPESIGEPQRAPMLKSRKRS